MDNTENGIQWIIDLGENDEYWADNLKNVPNMICIAYKHLRTLAREGKVYGAILQCKDVFELVCKTPLIMALIFIDENPEYKDTEIYSEIIRVCLNAPMSMGSWDALAGIIVREQKELQLPESIYQILKRTRKLYQAKISDSVSNVVNWRNNTIGHGVLKFENDPSYMKELSCLLMHLKEYFDGQKSYSIRGMYDNIYFLLDETMLIGEYWSEKIERGKVVLSLNGEKTETDHFVVNQNYKCYLFDSFYKAKKLVKYSSYSDGHSIVASNSYFAELANGLLMKNTKQINIHASFVKREEEKMLEFLNTPADYIEPVWLIAELEQKMEDLRKGIISVFMERGTGKSAFANQMNGLYHLNSLMPHVLSRCYHMQNAALRDKNDFINSVNFGFRHNLDPSEDLYGSDDELPMISFQDVDYKRSMANFLNKFHRIYDKDYTMLILDGIDEMTPDTSVILDFVPTEELLDDGVFVVLLSRFKDERTVLGDSKKYIENAKNLASEVIEIRRKSEINAGLLEELIRKNIPDINPQDTDSLVHKADYRFLYLKPVLAVKDKYDLDHTSEIEFIRSYLEYICSFYGTIQRTKIEEIAVAIALFPAISLNDYKKYIACQEISYEFVGLLNNLLPLMTVTHRDGVICYEFADKEYNDFIIKKYPDVVQTVIDQFYVSFSECLSIYLLDDGLRDFEKDAQFNSIELNNDIVFYAKFLIGIWNKAPHQCMISDMKIPEKNILKLYTNLIQDEWAKFGIGSYLREAMRDCICMNLYIGLLTDTVAEDSVSREWTSQIIAHIDNPDDYPGRNGVSSYVMIDYYLAESEKFDYYLLDFAIKNIKEIRDLKKWYWIFVRKCSDRVANAIVSVACVEDFVEYMLESAPPICYEEWFELLLNYNIPDRIKRRMKDELEHPTYVEKLDYRYYSEILENAIALFDDYTVPIKDDMGDVDEDNDGPIYTIFQRLSYGNKIVELLGKNAIHRLYVAFIKRLNYEREKGTFEDFICELYYLSGNQLSKIYEELFGEDWPEEASVIIPDLLQIEGGMYNFATDVLQKLMVSYAKWLEKRKRYEEEIDILRKLVSGIDCRHFLINHTYPIHFDKIMTSGGWSKEVQWYPTDNALYLLKLLNRLDLKKSIKPLMDAMELSCYAVDRNIYKDEELLVVHELQKYRFEQVRQELGYSSSFDEYISGIVWEHKNYISGEFKNISSRTDFGQINYHIELLLDYAWQLAQWKLGIEQCEGLLVLIESIALCENQDVVVKCINALKDKISRCRSLFLFMDGSDYNIEPDNKKMELEMTYDFTRYCLLRCVDIFEDDETDETEKRKWILEEIKIRLRD